MTLCNPERLNLDDVAVITRRVNVISVEEGGANGYNTEPEGLQYAFNRHGDFPENAPCLIIGAGGFADAALYALVLEMRCGDIFIVCDPLCMCCFSSNHWPG
jgi:shikimate 5-dehydrogenase